MSTLSDLSITVNADTVREQHGSEVLSSLGEDMMTALTIGYWGDYEWNPADPKKFRFVEYEEDRRLDASDWITTEDFAIAHILLIHRRLATEKINVALGYYAWCTDVDDYDSDTVDFVAQWFTFGEVRYG